MLVRRNGCRLVHEFEHIERIKRVERVDRSDWGAMQPRGGL
jgi:hypothetical protein